MPAERPAYLALDLAATSGVCWGVAFDPPQFATWVSTGANRGERAHNFKWKLMRALDEIRPAGVFIEEPLSPHVMSAIGSKISTAIQLNGLVFLAEEICHSRGVPTTLYERQHVLIHFTGTKSYPKHLKDGAKKACLLRCRQLKWDPAGYDEADAGALWDYGCAQANPRAWAMAGINRAVMNRRVKR